MTVKWTMPGEMPDEVKERIDSSKFIRKHILKSEIAQLMLNYGVSLKGAKKIRSYAYMVDYKDK